MCVTTHICIVWMQLNFGWKADLKAAFQLFGALVAALEGISAHFTCSLFIQWSGTLQNIKPPNRHCILLYSTRFWLLLDPNQKKTQHFACKNNHFLNVYLPMCFVYSTSTKSFYIWVPQLKSHFHTAASEANQRWAWSSECDHLRST